MNSPPELGNGYVPYAALPMVAQPKGWSYFFGTWSGRLLLINALVFVYVCVQTHSLFLPDTEALLNIGAKDPVRLAQGELWRFFTPMFVHIGILHFALNGYFLYAVGYQIERILGAGWFLATYLAAGVAGNIASSVFSVNLSAGASSSLFGLLGAGFFLERSIGRRIQEVTGRRPRNRAYTMTLGLNLLLGFLIPFIDNSAHLGGLVAGVLLTYAMINLRPNTLQSPRRVIGAVSLVLLLGLGGVGVYFGSSPSYIVSRLIHAGDKADDPEQQIYHYSQALEVDSKNLPLRLKRARVFFGSGETQYAFADVRVILAAGHGLDPQLELLASELEHNSKVADAWELRRMMAHGADGL